MANRKAEVQKITRENLPGRMNPVTARVVLVQTLLYYQSFLRVSATAGLEDLQVVARVRSKCGERRSSRMAVPLRADFGADGGGRCWAGRRCKDGPQARRLLALAGIAEGAAASRDRGGEDWR